MVSIHYFTTCSMFQGGLIDGQSYLLAFPFISIVVSWLVQDNMEVCKMLAVIFAHL